MHSVPAVTGAAGDVSLTGQESFAGAQCHGEDDDCWSNVRFIWHIVDQARHASPRGLSSTRVQEDKTADLV